MPAGGVDPPHFGGHKSITVALRRPTIPATRRNPARRSWWRACPPTNRAARDRHRRIQRRPVQGDQRRDPEQLRRAPDRTTSAPWPSIPRPPTRISSSRSRNFSKIAAGLDPTKGFWLKALRRLPRRPCDWRGADQFVFIPVNRRRGSQSRPTCWRGRSWPAWRSSPPASGREITGRRPFRLP